MVLLIFSLQQITKICLKKIGIDRSGRTGIDLGVYGIPETFIIKDGHVLYKHIGPIHVNEIEEKILPILNKERKQ